VAEVGTVLDEQHPAVNVLEARLCIGQLLVFEVRDYGLPDVALLRGKVNKAETAFGLILFVLVFLLLQLFLTSQNLLLNKVVLLNFLKGLVHAFHISVHLVVVQNLGFPIRVKNVLDVKLVWLHKFSIDFFHRKSFVECPVAVRLEQYKILFNLRVCI
jgi:hypothetical protein